MIAHDTSYVGIFSPAHTTQSQSGAHPSAHPHPLAGNVRTAVMMCAECAARACTCGHASIFRQRFLRLPFKLY